jgi:hypothetical protein
MQEFVDELKLQSSDNYSIDARFEAAIEKPNPLDKARNYVAASIEELKTAFNDGRFGRAALAGAKIGIVVGGVGLAGYVLFGNVQGADAAPLGDPVLTLPDSISWYDGFAKPTELDSFSGGATAKDNTIQGLVPSEDGFATRYSGVTFMGSTEIGQSGMRGLAPTLEGYITGSASSLYFTDDSLTLNGQSIDLLGIVSSIKSVDTAFYLSESAQVPGLGYSVFFTTESDGVRRLTSMSGDSVQIDSHSFDSIKVIEFNPNTYDNPMIQLEDSFVNLGYDGAIFGSSKEVDFDLSVDLQGTIYTSNGEITALVATSGRLYDSNQLAFTEHINHDVPEPTTITLLGLGALGLLGRRYKKHGSLFLPENKE